MTMPAKVNQDECTGCGDCVEQCPVEGVLVLVDHKAVVKQDECIECNACADACSSGAVKVEG
jgi:NAD-dependent dihydropyrimidine dehydrogenase PreA subunit